VIAEDAERIDATAFDEAQRRVSRWRVEDLEQEFCVVAPEIGRYLDALRDGWESYDSRGELEAVLARRGPARSDPRQVLEILVDASVIGCDPPAADGTRFRCEDPNLVLPVESGVTLHPAVRVALGARPRQFDTAWPIFRSSGTCMDDRFYVVEAAGEVDVFAIQTFRAAIDEALAKQLQVVIVDLSDVTLIDSSGVGVLLQAAARMRAADGDLRVVCPQGNLRRVFAITGMDAAIPLYDTVGAAALA
jgi:anti-sigma B factor antagonist